jgi:uncharacterized membrane protein YbjE (DUF340 family)
MGTRVLLVPAAVALGSVAAGTAAGVALGLPAADSAAASAGLAWYSLSAAVLTDLGGPMPGALALLVNLFRELIAFALTPLIARRMGFMEAIAPAGSTAMDTLLPVIARATDEQTALCAVICGFVLSAVMPLLATLLYRLL